MNERPLIIAQRLKEIHKELEQATLVAVTKYSPVEDVVMAYEVGQYDFGENRVSDLKEKAIYFEEHQLNNVRWHFIGHLQTNKVKDLLKIPPLHAIHSVDSMKLLHELIKHQAVYEGEKINIFLQFNTSHETEKSGFLSADELYEAINLINTENKFHFMGLMTMGTIRTETIEDEARRCFSDLFSLKNQIEKNFHLDNLKLSMGMSGDYQIAIKAGSDFVRIGSKIFK
jgi:pyridoxal phosphate enzyme (YggS family)